MDLSRTMQVLPVVVLKMDLSRTISYHINLNGNCQSNFGQLLTYLHNDIFSLVMIVKNKLGRGPRLVVYDKNAGNIRNGTTKVHFGTHQGLTQGWACKVKL